MKLPSKPARAARFSLGHAEVAAAFVAFVPSSPSSASVSCSALLLVMRFQHRIRKQIILVELREQPAQNMESIIYIIEDLKKIERE